MGGRGFIVYCLLFIFYFFIYFYFYFYFYFYEQGTKKQGFSNTLSPYSVSIDPFNPKKTNLIPSSNYTVRQQQQQQQQSQQVWYLLEDLE